MEYEFMTAATPLPPCMPFPKALAGLPISSTAKVMYCKMLDAMITKKLEDENGILFVYFPVRQLAAELSRCEMTVKRSLNELENVGLIMRVRRRGFAELNRIYILIPTVGAVGNGICAEIAGGRVEPAVRGSHAETGVCGLSFRHAADRDKVSDGELREKQTANYFSDIYPIDCAVLSANAQSCPKCCTLLPVLLSA